VCDLTDCLIAVPGSHSRVRTPEERATNMIPGSDIPGQQVLSLKAGQAVFYNNNILHVGKVSTAGTRFLTVGIYRKVGRADRRLTSLPSSLFQKYNLSVKRRTLHGCYGSPPLGDLTRGLPPVLFHSLTVLLF
jgi:hypothetical protein